jgi:hypothetical protein
MVLFNHNGNVNLTSNVNLTGNTTIENTVQNTI